MTKARLGYSPALDGLRGVFVLMFIGFHYGLTQLGGMWVTINYFFVLSGFLIFRLLAVEHAKYGSIDVLAFYRRRIRRLLPALLAVLTAVMAWGALFAPEGVRRGLGGDVLATLGYVMNWRLIAQGDQYFGDAGGASPLRHAWTLAIEEQFYVVAPFVLIAIFAVTRSRRAAIVILSIGAIASALWTAHLGLHDQSDYPRVYYGTDTRAQALCIGAAMGLLVGPRTKGERPTQLPLWIIQWGGSVCLVLSVGISYLFVTPYSAWMFNYGGMFAFGVLSILPVLACADHRPNVTQRVFSWRPVAFLGERTYGLYLWHWPIFVALSLTALGEHAVLLFLISLALTIGTAHISYVYLERPIISRGIRGVLPRTRQPLLLSVMPVALVALMGVGMVATAPAAPNDDLTPVAASGEIPELVTSQPEYQPDAPGSIGVLGDSVPYYLVERLPREEFPGVEIHNYTGEGCDLLDQPVSYAPGLSKKNEPWCVDLKRRWYRDFERRGDDVLLLFSSPLIGVPHLVEGERVWLDSSTLRDAITQRLETIYGQAKRAGAEQVQVVNVPCRTPPEEVPAEVQVDEDPAIVAEYEDPVILNGLIADWAKRHPRDVEVIDLDTALCAEGTQEVIRGVPVYNDFLHFSPEATPMLWKWILGQVSKNYASIE